MKIAYASDLHLEMGAVDIENTENADVLILAGDIFTADGLVIEQYVGPNLDLFNYKSFRIHTFIEKCCKEFKHVLMVCGNHESYHFDIDKTISHIKNNLDYGNFHLLDNSCFAIDDVIFTGGTLWTDMNKEDLETLHDIRSLMNDFRVINKGKYKFTPEDVLDYFKETIDYIDLMSVIHKDEKIVVVTHHAPSFKSVDPIYENHTLLNGGYCSNLENFIIDRKNIKLWISGHLHNRNLYYIGDTLLASNPRGYIGYEECANNFKLEYLDLNNLPSKTSESLTQ
ncbi:Calcineurin-like phosphoesterase domain, ApaH type [uncultured Caudovirales phage]|uniref:Calcineurin-like phosphoesterase domain, ApaH type n=1 Tax=uncultured Caudovirales phage TaxID=2100421 RepID=A0A6J5L4I7_9CAUD|nr:Calcineurin-like phosphoesterase domain, ApaH type [uncultured Caudovirales phage]